MIERSNIDSDIFVLMTFNNYNFTYNSYKFYKLVGIKKNEINLVESINRITSNIRLYVWIKENEYNYCIHIQFINWLEFSSLNETLQLSVTISKSNLNWSYRVFQN